MATNNAIFKKHIIWSHCPLRDTARKLLQTFAREIVSNLAQFHQRKFKAPIKFDRLKNKILKDFAESSQMI